MEESIYNAGHDASPRTVSFDSSESRSALIVSLLEGVQKPVEGRGYLPLPGCHARCGGCSNNYLIIPKLQYASEVTDAVAKQLVDLHIAETQNLRENLQEALQMHGDLIMTRWMKRSRDRRAQLLRAASPLFVEQGYDLVEWLDINALLDDKSKLLAVLHVRAINPASAWATFDTKSSALDFQQGGVLYNQCCVQMCGKDYGRMVPQDVDLLHAFAFMGFPRAHMTLQIQLEIMRALRGVVTNIIDRAAGTGNTKWNVLTAAGIRSSGSNMLFSAYTDQGFSNPSAFNPHSMLEKAKTRLDLAFDEVELMQTDVAFMQAVLRTRKADIDRENGRIDFTKLWGKIGLDLMAEFINRIRTWSSITDVLKRVCKIFEEHAANISPGNELNEMTDDAMHNLSYVLTKCRRARSYFLECEMPNTRTMRAHYVTREEDGMVEMVPKDTRHSTPGPCDRIRKCMDSLRRQILLCSCHDLSPLFKLVQSQLCDQRSSEPADGRLSDLMLIDELMSAWLFHQYIPSRIELEDLPTVEDMLSSETGLTEDTVTTAIGPPAAVRAGKIVKEFMDMPWPKGRRDSAWFTKATECRRRLSNMWSILRKELRDADITAGIEPEVSDKSLLMMQFDTSPGHIADMEKERQECEAITNTEIATASAKGKTTEQSLQIWSDGDEVKPVQRKQTKAKAARLAVLPPDDSLVSRLGGLTLQTPTSQKVEQPAGGSNTTIPAKQESLSLFSKLFCGNSGEAKSNVRWDVFLQAMADAGVTATDASGSAVSFSNGEGRIVFHRPHPDPNIDPIMLHAMSRRLRKWFGWSAERFVLREKE